MPQKIDQGKSILLGSVRSNFILRIKMKSIAGFLSLMVFFSTGYATEAPITYHFSALYVNVSSRNTGLSQEACVALAAPFHFTTTGNQYLFEKASGVSYEHFKALANLPLSQ